MTGNELDIVAEREQLFLDRGNQRGMIAAREIGTPDRSLEKHVANLRELAVSVKKHDMPRRMPRAMQNSQFDLAETHAVAVLQPARRDEGGACGKAEHATLLRHALNPERIVGMRSLDRYSRLLGQGGGPAGMIDVAMRDQHLAQGQAFGGQHGQDPVNIASGIDNGGLAGFFAPEHGAVLLERRDGKNAVTHGIRPAIKGDGIISRGIACPRHAGHLHCGPSTKQKNAARMTRR